MKPDPVPQGPGWGQAYPAFIERPSGTVAFRTCSGQGDLDWIEGLPPSVRIGSVMLKGGCAITRGRVPWFGLEE